MFKKICAIVICVMMLVGTLSLTAFAADDATLTNITEINRYDGYNPIPLIVIVVSYDANGNGIDDCAANNFNTSITTNSNRETYGEQWAYTKEADWAQNFFGDEGKTVKNYWKTMSNDKFWFYPANETYGEENNGIVYVTINAQHPHAAANGNANARSDYQTRALALRAAAEYVDFSSFDKNGNGIIDYQELTISLVIAGYNEKWGSRGKNSQQVWGFNNYQMNNNSSGIVVDGVELTNGSKGGRFIIDGECRENGEIAAIGTFTHELGHVLGAPDLYTYSGYTWIGGPGNKALQGTGSNNYRKGEKSGDSPAAVDPYHLMFYGFEREEVVGDGTYTLYSRESEHGYNIIRVNTADPDIYYLVENRYTEDPNSYDGDIGDSQLTYGIIVWRVHQATMNTYALPNCVAKDDEGTHDRPGLEPCYDGTDLSVVKCYEYYTRTVVNSSITATVSHTIEDCNTTIEILSKPGHEMQIKVENAVTLPGVDFVFNATESTQTSIAIVGKIDNLNGGDVTSAKATLKTTSGTVVKEADITWTSDATFSHEFTGLEAGKTYVCEVSVAGTEAHSANTVSKNVFTNPEEVKATSYVIHVYKNLTENEKAYNVNVKFGEKFTYTFPMKKTGYAFVGWYTDEALTQKYDMNFTQNEANDINIYAKWVPTAEAATITFKNATVTNKVFSATVGDTFVEPVVAEKEGFEFTGWYTDAALTQKFDFSAPVSEAGDITLYAGWKDLSAGGDDNNTTSENVTPGDSTTAPIQNGGDAEEPSDNKGSATGVIIAVVAVVVVAGVAVAVVVVMKKKK